jgi:cell division protein FtsW
MSFRRSDARPIAEWWRTVDRLLLATVLALGFAGLLLTLAASPLVAVRIGQPEHHFVVRQLLFLGPAIGLMIAISLTGVREVRRLSLAIFLVSICLMIIAIAFGAPIKGATRWLTVGPVSIQPSEFAKPAFVVLSAWFFAEGTRRRDQPGHLVAVLLYLMFAALLVLQPDFGQTMLVTLVWGALFFMAGMAWIWSAVIGAVSMAGLAGAYIMVPHVTQRVDSFLHPGSGDTFQVDTAREAILNGGWLGQGPGEGTVKRILPDAHTDFIFAVAAEEFGIIACVLLVLVFAFIVLRGMSHALRERDPFVRLAAAGLSVLIGVQAGINMAVNLGLAPAKGMTLPMVSYGGSSLISVAIAIGMILALTRRRPGSRVMLDGGGIGATA